VYRHKLIELCASACPVPCSARGCRPECATLPGHRMHRRRCWSRA
jgi:hypothetical protein